MTDALPTRTSPMRGHTLALIMALVVQFLVGMWVNLFVSIPANHPGVSPDYFVGALYGVPWALLHGGPMLELHILLGLIIGVLALGHLVRSARAQTPGTLGWSIVGMGGVLGAAGNGASFLNYGRNFSSMLMSVAFAIALIAYLVPMLGTEVAGNGRGPAA